MHHALMLLGIALGLKFGGWLGGLFIADRFLAYLSGLLFLTLSFTAFGKYLANREGGDGGTSPLGLWVRGLGWRFAARLVLVAVVTAPLAALIWAWRSGWITKFLAGVSS